LHLAATDRQQTLKVEHMRRADLLTSCCLSAGVIKWVIRVGICGPEFATFSYENTEEINCTCKWTVDQVS